MERTPQQIEEVKQEYAARRRRQLLVTVPVFVFILLFVFTENKEAKTLAGLPERVWLPVFLVVVIGLLVFSLFNWRCPSCSSYIGRNWNPRFCSRCGVALRD